MKYYKYLDLNGKNGKKILSSLKKHLIKLTDFDNLNDITEAHLGIDGNYDEVLNSLGISNDEIKIKQGIEIAIKKRKSEYGLLCLSGKYNSQCMWAHYSGNNTGICVQVETPEEIDDFMKEIDYVNPRQYLEMNCKLLKEPPQKSLIGSKNEAEYLAEPICDIFFNNLNKKSNEWKYEKEFRAVLPIKKHESIKCIQQKKDRFYIKINITGITVGFRFGKGKLDKKLVKWAKEENIPILKIRLSNKADYLDVEPYNV